MKTIKDIQQEILKLKKENDICILAHSYEAHEILEIADFTGDSYALSVKAKGVDAKTLIMCGVRFMAETVKILSPNKRVLLSNSEAGCPMAEQLTVEELKKLKNEHPNACVVAYINTTAALKCECDVCVTSASAVELVKNLPNEEIVFIPDPNLGAYVKSKVPNKKFYFIDGGCPVHKLVTTDDVLCAREKHKDAKILVHPECSEDVVSLCDFAGSTTAIMDYVRKSDENEFVIGTENSIVQHLQFEFPEKKFYPLTKDCVCKDMRLTTLVDVYNCVKGIGGEEIILDEYTMTNARKCIDNMLK